MSRTKNSVKPKADSKADSKPESKPESKSESKPDSKLESKPESNSPKAGLQSAAFTYQQVTGALVMALEPQPWALCRPLDEDRVEKLRREQAKKIAVGLIPDLFLPTPITIANLRGQCFVMDGQHRLEVLRRLELDPALVQLALCEVHCRTQEEMEELHVRLNGGKALPASYYKKKLADWLDRFAELLVKAFPKSISASDRPRRPNFNPTLVKKQLAALPALHDAVADGALSVEKMMEIVHAENTIEEKVTEGGGKGLTISLISKAKRVNFALGLRCDWPVSIAVRALLQ